MLSVSAPHLVPFASQRGWTDTGSRHLWGPPGRQPPTIRLWAHTAHSGAALAGRCWERQDEGADPWGPVPFPSHPTQVQGQPPSGPSFVAGPGGWARVPVPSRATTTGPCLCVRPQALGPRSAAVPPSWGARNTTRGARGPTAESLVTCWAHRKRGGKGRVPHAPVHRRAQRGWVTGTQSVPLGCGTAGPVVWLHGPVLGPDGHTGDACPQMDQR